MFYLLLFKVRELEGNGYQSLRILVNEIEEKSRLKTTVARRMALRNERPSFNSSDFIFFKEVMSRVQLMEGEFSVQWVLKGQENTWVLEASNSSLAAVVTA